MSECLFCNECHTAVRLERGDDRRLRVKCACGTDRRVKVKQALPDGWQR